MQRLIKRGLVFLVSMTGAVSLTIAGPARGDLALAAACSEIPLSSGYDRAAAAAALPTFVGINQICVLQALLATVGILPGSRVVDGRYDRQTRDALKSFQVSNAIAGNGLLTPETMDALAGAALDEIYSSEPAAPAPQTPTVSEVQTDAETVDPEPTSADPTISEALAALKMAAPAAAPVLNLAPAPKTIELPSLSPVVELDETITTQTTTETVEPTVKKTTVLSSVSDGEVGTISRSTSTVVVETTLGSSVEEATAAIEQAVRAGTLPNEPQVVGQTTTTTTTYVETISAQPETPLVYTVDPLSDTTVADFVSPSICHAPSSAQDRDLIRNSDRIPPATCLRTFVGAGNLPFQVFSLEVLNDGPTVVVMHDGDDATFDAALATLNTFGGRLVVLNSAESTRTTTLGANPEILTVSPSSNIRCDWSPSEQSLAFAIHDYIVAGSKPVLLLRQNETRQFILDSFNSGALRFELNALGPARELFDPLVAPLADQAFAELMVTSATRRSAQTRAIVRTGVESGLPVALTQVDALGMRDQCGLEALARQTDLPVMRVLLGRTEGVQAENIIAASIRSVGLREKGTPVAQTTITGVGTEGEIPASVLALAAGGLDVQLEDNLTANDQYQPRTLVAALGPGLPPMPLDRPAEYQDTLFGETGSSGGATDPISRITASGISVGTGVDALSPVAVGGADGFVVSAEVSAGNGYIVEESLGPVTALPPNPMLRPISDLSYRLVPDGTDPVLAMDGEAYYAGTTLGTDPSRTLYTINGQVYDPNVQPRIISSRTIQTTVPSNPFAVSTSQPGFTTSVPTIYTQQGQPQPSTGNVSGPLYGNGQGTYVAPIQPPSNETIIIDNTIY